MEESINIDDENIWKKVRPASADQNYPDYLLKSSAPNNVDVWQFKSTGDIENEGIISVIKFKTSVNFRDF